MRIKINLMLLTGERGGGGECDPPPLTLKFFYIKELVILEYFDIFNEYDTFCVKNKIE